jgi:hypothetical protein
VRRKCNELMWFLCVKVPVIACNNTALGESEEAAYPGGAAIPMKFLALDMVPTNRLG